MTDKLRKTGQLQFTVDVEPRGWERAGSCVRNGHVHHFTPEAMRKLQAVIATFAKLHIRQPVDGVALAVDVTAIFPRPKSLPLKLGHDRRLHTSKPDADNVVKLILDALNGVVWKDDAQVCDLHVSKFVAAFGEQPHYEITIAILQPQGSLI